jgi:hypothetical protein
MAIQYNTKVNIIGTLSSNEEKVLNKYWAVDFSKKPYKFQLSVNEHKEINTEDCRTITQILKHGRATCDHPSFNCSSCSNNFSTNSRKEFLSKLKKTNWLCQSCETQAIYSELKPYIDNLEIWDEKSNLNNSNLLSNLNSLEFIYLLALYIKLKDISSEKLSSKTSLIIQKLNLTGSQNLDEKILNQLVKKNILKKIGNDDTFKNTDYQKILRAYDCSVHHPREIQEIIRKFDKKFYFCEPNSYLLGASSDHKSLLEIYIAIKEKLNDYEMNINELSYLNIYVDNLLEAKAFKLLDLVRKNYFIPIKKSPKIERLLNKTMDLLTLEQAYSWLNFVGKQAAETIDSNRKLDYLNFNKYQENYIFLNILESYLNLIEKEERKSFIKILPKELYATNSFEQYLSEIVSEIGVSFISMNGRDIKKRLAEYYLR